MHTDRTRTIWRGVRLRPVSGMREEGGGVVVDPMFLLSAKPNTQHPISGNVQVR